MTPDSPLPDGITANATDDGKVSLMVPTSDANAERRGVIVDTDEAIDAARDIFAAVDEARDDTEDDGVVFVSAGPLPNGVYLIADTPRTAHPLAVEDGSGDRALLREALAENDVAGFGSSTDYPEVRRFVKGRISGDEDGDGAPVAEVIEDTATEYTLGVALDVLRDLHRTGEVYAPSKTTLRTT